MDTHQNKNRDLFPILMVNSLLWALTIVVNLIVFYRLGMHTRLFTVLACGTVVSIVAVSMA